MRKFIFFILIIFSIPLFSEWHPWSEEPQEGQLIMYIELSLCAPISDRQLLIITHFRRDYLKVNQAHNGWWDVGVEELDKWFSEGSKAIYLP